MRYQRTLYRRIPVMIDLGALRAQLAAMRAVDGGWGYSVGQPAHLEPTCLAILALDGTLEGREACGMGWQFLDGAAETDGSYRETRREATWPTAIVLFTRAALRRSGFETTAERLLGLRGNVVETDPEIADMMDINVRLVGWPWAEGNFSWIEPTAWACLALRRAGRGSHPAVAEGLQLLIDRSLDEGGVNYGNRRVLGRLTEPIPTPTALMLLALQGAVDHPRVDAAADYLVRSAMELEEVEHLAWTILATQASAAPQAVLIEKLASALFRSNLTPARLALALLALDEAKRQLFRLNDSPVVASRPQVAEPTSPAPPPIWQRIVSTVRGVFVRGLGIVRGLPDSSAVHIADAENYDAGLVDVLRKQFVHFRNRLSLADKRIVLKPNLVEYHRDKVINTDPRFVAAVVEWCRSEGAAEVIVAEGPGHWRNVECLLESSGLGEVLRQADVPFVDLNHDEPVKLLNLGRCTGLDHLYLAETAVTADVLISLPKLKTHHWSGATLALKNLFGIAPGICYGWPKNELHWRGISNSVVDIALSCTPQLAIVDAIVGMEGDGPLNGTAKHVGAVVMGMDLAAVDATCCRLMGLEPHRVPYLLLAEKKKFGRIDEAAIPQAGLPIAVKAQQFELPPKIDRQLLASA